MKLGKRLILALGIAYLLQGPAWSKDEIVWRHKDKAGHQRVDLYVFWSRDCSVCHKALPFLRTLEKKHPWIALHMKELERGGRKGPVHAEYIRMGKAVGEQPWSIPAFFFCNRLYMGWVDEESTGTWLINKLRQCRRG